MRTLEEATADMVNAREWLQGYQMVNVYGRSHQELIDMEISRQKKWIEYNRAKAEVDEIVEHESKIK